MSLITTIEEVNQHLVADASFNPQNVLPFIASAKNEIINVLGNSQYQELLDYYESGSNGISELDLLLPYVQKPLFYFAFLRGLDNFNVSIGANGIAIVNSSGLAPASTDRVEKLRTSIELLAYESLEDLLLYLECNTNDFPLWLQSDAYSFQHQFLIFSARKFSEFFQIKNSRQTYLSWRSTMYDKEVLHVATQISAEFLQELKNQIANDSVTEENEKVLSLLQRGIAYMTASEYLDPKYQANGLRYIIIAKKIMDDNPTAYPTYAASAQYSLTNPSYNPYENDSENKLIFF